MFQQVAKNVGHWFLFFGIIYVVHPHIQINFLTDDPHFCYITQILGKKQGKKYAPRHSQ
jgi:hypothetical protein